MDNLKEGLIESVLERMASVLNANSYVELSRALGVESKTIYNWRQKGEINFGLIKLFELFHDVNLNWLLSGEGFKNLTPKKYAYLQSEYERLSKDYSSLEKRYLNLQQLHDQSFENFLEKIKERDVKIETLRNKIREVVDLFFSFIRQAVDVKAFRENLIVLLKEISEISSVDFENEIRLIKELKDEDFVVVPVLHSKDDKCESVPTTKKKKVQKAKDKD